MLDLEGVDEPVFGVDGADEIEGLGRVIARKVQRAMPKMPKAQATKVGRTLARQAVINHAKHTGYQTRDQKYVSAYLNSLPVDTKKALGENIKFIDGVRYTRKVLTTGNTMNVFEAKDKLIKGVRNIAGNKLGASENLLFSKLSVSLGLVATTGVFDPNGDTAPNVPVYTNFIDPAILSANPALQTLFNSDVKFTAGNKLVYMGMLADFFCTEHSQQRTETGRRYQQIEAVKLLLENLELDFQITFPDGISLPSANPSNPSEKWYWFIEVAMKGLQSAQNGY